MILQSRRKFLTTLTGIIAAPAVIRADALMRVRGLPFDPYVWIEGKNAFGGVSGLKETAKLYGAWDQGRINAWVQDRPQFKLFHMVNVHNANVVI